MGCGMVSTSQNMQGVQLYQKGQLYGAMEKFQKAMATDPNDANAYYNMASSLHRLGIANKDPNALQQAEQLYNECLNRNPNHTDCYRALAVLLVETDRTLAQVRKITQDYGNRVGQIDTAALSQIADSHIRVIPCPGHKADPSNWVHKTVPLLALKRPGSLKAAS